MTITDGINLSLLTTNTQTPPIIGKLGGFNSTIWSSYQGNTITEKITLVDLDNDARKRPDIKIVERNGQVSVFEVKQHSNGTEEWVESQQYASFANQEFQETEDKKHKVQRGDVLSTIAQQYGISVAALKKANNIPQDSSLIKTGQTLIIPTSTQPLSDNLNYANCSEVNLNFPNKTDIEPTSAIDDSAQNNQVVKVEKSATGEPTIVLETTKAEQTNTAKQPEAKPWDEKKIKQQTLKLVFEYAKKKENFEPTPKDCTAGYPTIGYGHKVKKGEKFTRLSKKEAAKLLAKDLQKAYNQVVTALGDSVKNLNEIQLAALVSMAFNSGGNAFANSEYLALIKEGKFDEAQAKMDAVWGNKTDAQGNIVRDENGKPIKEIKNGLLIRRTEEMIMFGDGKLCEAAKARVLELLNQSFGTQYASLEEASKEMLAELYSLERKNSTINIQAKQKAAGKKVKNLQPPMTAAENAKLRRLRNIKALFDILKNPPSFKTE